MGVCCLLRFSRKCEAARYHFWRSETAGGRPAHLGIPPAPDSIAAMQRYDLIVIGLTRAGAAVADAAVAAGRKVAAVRLSEADEQADLLSYALEDMTPPQPGPVRFDILSGPAAFLNARRLSVGGSEVTARRFVIAVGALPRFPDGL